MILWSCNKGATSTEAEYDGELEIEDKSQEVRKRERVSLSELNNIADYRFSVGDKLKSKIDGLILDSILKHDYYLNEASIQGQYSPKPISVYKISGSKLLITCEYHNPFGLEGLHGELSIVDIESLNVVSRQEIQGGKYHAPKLIFEDLDKDGDKEVRVQLVLPTSSVPVIDKYETIYEVDENTGAITRALEVCIESLDCATRHLEKSNETGLEGDFIKRTYKFISATRMELIEENYKFNCEEFTDSIKASKKLMSRAVIFLERTNDKGIFN